MILAGSDPRYGSLNKLVPLFTIHLASADHLNIDGKVSSSLSFSFVQECLQFNNLASRFISKS